MKYLAVINFRLKGRKIGTKHGKQYGVKDTNGYEKAERRRTTIWEEENKFHRLGNTE